jgi:hypothetical protein
MLYKKELCRLSIRLKHISCLLTTTQTPTLRETWPISGPSEQRDRLGSLVPGLAVIMNPMYK